MNCKYVVEANPHGLSFGDRFTKVCLAQRRRREVRLRNGGSGHITRFFQIHLQNDSTSSLIASYNIVLGLLSLLFNLEVPLGVSHGDLKPQNSECKEMWQ
jgi:hypothetical protein